MTIRKDFERGGEAVRVTCEPQGDERFVVRIGDVAHEVDAHRTPDGQVSFTFGDRTFVAAMKSLGPCAAQTWS